jgi:hypothetical protein
VAELILITNLGDKVVIAEGEGQPTLSFDLPDGAQNVQFEDGALGTQYVMLPDGGFGDLRGISPGISSHQILFSFDMPYNRGFSLDQVVPLPVDALVVLLPDTGVEVDGDALVAGGERDIDGRTYQLFTGGSLSAGSQLPIALSGTPDFGTGLATGSSDNSLSIGLTAFGVVLIGVGIWVFRRRAVESDTYDEMLEEEEPVPEHITAMDTEDLMDAIIALDDRFKAGDLPEGAYLKQRALLKQQLQDQMAGS